MALHLDPTRPGPAAGTPPEAPEGVRESRDRVPEARVGRMPADQVDLSPSAREQVRELQRRDAEVRAHEAAHMAAGGSLVKGGASFGYKRGPDGQMYAVSGEVTLDTGPEKDPRATLAKANRIRAAALAPRDPSPADRAAASAAGAMAAAAAAELARQGQPVSTALAPSPTGAKVARRPIGGGLDLMA